MKSSTVLDLCSDVNFSNEQEFYVWLVTDDIASYGLPKFNPEFLKNYEIAKLVLEEFGISYLRKNYQTKLNLEAVSDWFRVSYYIYLLYDIPEILELLPERIVEDLELQNAEIKSLPNLESVGRDLSLYDSQIESLPKLESVGGFLTLKNSKIQYLPKLESVGGLIFANKEGVEYWKNYFNNTERPHLAKKVTDE